MSCFYDKSWERNCRILPGKSVFFILFISGIQILLKYQSEAGRTLKDLKAFTSSNEAFKAEINDLGARVEKFTSDFDIPGNEDI